MLFYYMIYKDVVITSQIRFKLPSPFTMFFFWLSPFSEQPPLPNGVTKNDVDLYKEVREQATHSLAELMSLNTKVSFVRDTTPEPVLPKKPLQSSKLQSPSKFMAAQERCPAAIEFGKYEIQTWYSSPFPQEYAR